MKKQFVLFVVLFFCLNASYASDEDILEAVENNARTWLAYTDTGRYQESWNNASPQFRVQQPEAEWVKTIRSIRSPQGAIEARYLAAAGYTQAPSGFSEGEFIMLQFYATFSKSGLSSESVTLEKQANNTWLVAEYEIK